MDDTAADPPPPTAPRGAGSTSSTPTAESPSADPITALGEKILKELGEEHTNNTLIRWLSHHTARLMHEADEAARNDDPSAPAHFDEARTAILQLWQARSTWPQGWPPPRAAAMAAILDSIPDLQTSTWFKRTPPARLQHLHHVILAALVDLTTTGTPDADQGWLDNFDGHLNNAEVLLLRRASETSLDLDALEELATLIERYGAPSPAVRAQPSDEEAEGHPLLSLVDAYRKIILEVVQQAGNPPERPGGAGQ